MKSTPDLPPIIVGTVNGDKAILSHDGSTASFVNGKWQPGIAWGTRDFQDMPEIGDVEIRRKILSEAADALAKSLDRSGLRAAISLYFATEAKRNASPAPIVHEISIVSAGPRRHSTTPFRSIRRDHPRPDRREFDFREKIHLRSTSLPARAREAATGIQRQLYASGQANAATLVSASEARP
jgi:hypothetical protein